MKGMKVWVAMWKWSGSDNEISLHETEEGACQSITEEAEAFLGQENFCFSPGEYADLLAGETLVFKDEDSRLWVSMRQTEVMQ